MKRKTTSSPEEPAKRLRLDQEPVDPAKFKSLREQAEPYRLGTAKFSIEALTSTWSLGSNRQIHEKHTQSLCRIFEEQGLQREAAENHLLITCTQAEVQRMVARLEQSRHNTPEWERNPSLWPSFDDWIAVNGSKAEILVGQHRVEALKLYLRRISSRNPGKHVLEKDQSWWICDIYDKDRLPAQLSVRLRANRQGSILPDSHGQVWVELATLAATDGSLFQGTNAQVQDEMLRALSLSGRVPFPMRRLMTLWKNRSWQPMVTRWCYTAIGRETFNVSLWEEMARHRIDDFWFDIFETVLDSISRLTGEASGSIKLDDWNILARDLPSRSLEDIRASFYPDIPVEVLAELEARGHSHRRAKFLTAFDHITYYRMYKTILENPDLQFPDIQTLFRNGRNHGKIMSQVMNHVGQWLNLRPMQISDRDNNKPQLWRDFLPTFQEYGIRSEELALRLQRQVFTIVHKRIDEFANGMASAYLSKLPADSQADAYLERFMLPIWNDLLVRVHEVVGPRFQGSLAKFNTQSPPSLPIRPEVSSLTQVLRAAISRVPEIRVNPALCGSQALEVLVARIEPIVTDWVAQEGGKARKIESRSQSPVGPTRAWDIITLKHSQLSAVMSGPGIDEVDPPRCNHGPIPSTAVPVSVHSERRSGACAIEEARQMDCIKQYGTGERVDFSINRPSIVKINS